MAEYVVIGFPGKDAAMKVLEELESSGEFDHSIEAVAVVSCDEQKCSIVQRSTAPMTKDVMGGTMAGGVTGMHIGTGIADPEISPFMQTSSAGLGEEIKGDLSKIGIEEAFSHDVDSELGPNSSAICFILWEEPWNDFPPEGKKIIQEASGTITKTTLSVEHEAQLRANLVPDQPSTKSDKKSPKPSSKKPK